MTPEDKQKLEQALELLKSIQIASDVVFSESVRKRVVKDKVGFTTDNVAATTANINQSVGDIEAFTSPKKFDKRLKIDLDGVKYYIGLYNV